MVGSSFGGDSERMKEIQIGNFADVDVDVVVVGCAFV